MKASFTFQEPAMQVISTIAIKRSISRAEVIRRALMFYEFVDRVSCDGTLTTSSEGKTYRVKIP